MKTKKVQVTIPIEVDNLITRYQAAYRIVHGKHAPTKAEVISKGIDQVNLQRVVQSYEEQALEILDEAKRPVGRPKIN
jgi:hypothetical protein